MGTGYRIYTREACKGNRCFRMTAMARMSVSNASLCFLVAVFILGAASPQGIAAQSLRIVYLETPSNVTSQSNATFEFNVVDGNGTSPCGLQQNCTFGCKVSDPTAISFMVKVFVEGCYIL